MNSRPPQQPIVLVVSIVSDTGVVYYSISLYFFVPHLRPMGLNVLGHQSHLLQIMPSCPACGHEGSSLTTRQPMAELYLLSISLSATTEEGIKLLLTRIELPTSALLINTVHNTVVVVGMRGYHYNSIIDHLGDEYRQYSVKILHMYQVPATTAAPYNT